MKKILLNPLCAPLAAILYVVIYFFAVWLTRSPAGVKLYTDTTLECVTYATYIITLPIILWCARDFKGAMKHYILFVFLWICGLLREAGIQHCLTTTDTTAFKLRFFTSPKNPLHEKIIAAFVLLTVLGIAAYLIVYYTPKIIKGFFKLNPLYWTICTLGGMGVLAKVFDRIPGNYRKIVGEFMATPHMAFFGLLEEISETTLPLLVAFAFIQYHLMKKNETAYNLKYNAKN